MFIILTILQGLIAAALVGVILIQKSDGNGLGGMGGSPTGLMSARGAADTITKITQGLAVAFVFLSIILGALAVKMGAAQKVEATLNRTTAAPVAPAPASGQPPLDQPGQPLPQSPSQNSVPQNNSANPLDPLSGLLKK